MAEGSPTRHLRSSAGTAAAPILGASRVPEEPTLSEILLAVLSEALGAAVLALVMAAVKRAVGAARA